MSLSANFKKYLIRGEAVSTLPRLEMMPYHEDTLTRWRTEGLPASVRTQAELHDYFALTRLDFFFIWPDLVGAGCRGKIASASDFASVRGPLYAMEKVRARMDEYKRTLDAVETADGILWIPLHGFFWHPRDLLGVTEHLMMFYDVPALIHDINKSLLEFNMEAVRMLAEVGSPCIICVSEDMAGKNGAMISRQMFDEYVAPYHRPLLREIKKTGAVAALDSDGEITAVTRWFAEIGYDCINPLERQTGMDLWALRDSNPDMSFLGGYNKRVVAKGRDAIRAEFDTLMPLFRRGRFIPAMDHQTPPDVSLENYRCYLDAYKAFFRDMGVLST